MNLRQRIGDRTQETDSVRWGGGQLTVVAPLAVILEEQRRWLFSTQHPGLASGLVFPASPRHARAGASRRGAEELTWYRGKTALDKPLAKVVREAGGPAISIHSLRRTWEDILRLAGVDQLVRRALAGWRTETAQQMYATVDRSERDAAADAVVGLVMEEWRRGQAGWPSSKIGTAGRCTRGLKSKTPGWHR